MADAPKRAKSSRKNRKHGRAKAACLRYRNANRREHNKARRLKKHLAKWPRDLCAKGALDRCFLVIRPSLG